MKIVFFEIQGWEKKILRKSLKGHDLEFFKSPLNDKSVVKAKNADVISVFVYSEVNKKCISKMSKVKLITTRSTGFDHIDIEAANKKGIKVCNVPFYGENTVAEHTFALILTLSRNIHKSYIKSLQGNFKITGLMGFDIRGKTLGVVGAGHIGQHVIKIAKGFGMKVLAFDVHKNSLLSEVLNFEYATMDKLLAESDIITIHLPLNEHTDHLIDKKAFAKMKKGAILVNTSRGGIIDTDALLAALDDKTLSAAALDVMEDEKYIVDEKQLLYESASVEVLRDIARDRLIISKENVLYTPHIAFYTKEALARIVRTSAGNIASFIDGRVTNEVKVEVEKCKVVIKKAKNSKNAKGKAVKKRKSGKK